MRELFPDTAKSRVIVAHLGSGASMCALADGQSVESTMGFTALDGLPMGTRPGQIDPGVVLYLISEKGMSAEAIQKFLYSDCGLKGLSGISNDMRVLETGDEPGAKLAIDYLYTASVFMRACWPQRLAGSMPSYSPRGSARIRPGCALGSRKSSRGSGQNWMQKRMPAESHSSRVPDSRLKLFVISDRRRAHDCRAHARRYSGRSPAGHSI